MALIPYKKRLIQLARKLRKNSTLGKILLWKQFSGRKFYGLQFNRQKPLGKYIVDFYCKTLNLVIEIDDYSHGFKEVHQKDKSKQVDLESMGLTVLRFSESEVRNSMDSILQTIEAFIKSKNPPNPLFKGEEYLPRHIYLCGFMGSGKTTVGALLAAKLGFAFIDTDCLIELNENRTIRNIFENSGEACFRELENKIIQQIVRSDQNAVIALGGGSLLREENLDLVKTDGYLIYLKCELSLIAERLKTDSSRPLLQQANIDALFEQRKSGYESADLIIETQNQSPSETTEALLHHLSSKKSLLPRRRKDAE